MELLKESLVLSIEKLLYQMQGDLDFKCLAHARGVSVERAAAEQIVEMFCRNLLTPTQEKTCNY